MAEIRTTTIRISDIDSAKLKAIAKEFGQTFNALIREVLHTYINTVERERIDREFETMATDEDYQRMIQKLMKEFEYADAEAIAVMQ